MEVVGLCIVAVVFFAGGIYLGWKVADKIIANIKRDWRG